MADTISPFRPNMIPTHIPNSGINEMGLQHLPVDVLEAMERGDLDEAIHRLQHHGKEGTEPNGLLDFLKGIGPMILGMLVKSPDFKWKAKPDADEKTEMAVKENPITQAIKRAMHESVALMMKSGQWIKDKALTIKDAGVQIAENAVNLMVRMGKAWMQIQQQVVTKSEKAFESLLNAGHAVAKPVKDMANAMVDLATPWVKAAADFADETVRRVKEMIEKRSEQLQKATEAAMKPVKEIIKESLDQFQKVWQKETQRIQSVVDAQTQKVAQVADQARIVVVAAFAPVAVWAQQSSAYSMVRVRAGAKKLSRALSKSGRWITGKAFSAFNKTVDLFSGPVLIVSYVLHSLLDKLLVLLGLFFIWLWKKCLIVIAVVPLYARKVYSVSLQVCKKTPHFLFRLITAIPRWMIRLLLHSLRLSS